MLRESELGDVSAKPRVEATQVHKLLNVFYAQYVSRQESKSSKFCFKKKLNIDKKSRNGECSGDWTYRQIEIGHRMNR